MLNVNRYEHVEPTEIHGDGGGKIAKKEVYTSDQYAKLAKVLINQIKDQGYTSIIAIARGGLSILSMLQKYGGKELGNQIKYGALHAASYTAIGQQKDIHIADGISFYGGGGPGAKPLFLDDMLDSANSKKAIDLWAKSSGVAKDPKWAVLLEKEHSAESATHVAQHMGNEWVVQPHEFQRDDYPGENIAAILTRPHHIMGADGDFDNLQKLAEMIGVDIFRSGNTPSAIIGVGDIDTAHVASMVSRILALPSGTHFDGGRLSFVNPSQVSKDELGLNPVRITLPIGMRHGIIATNLRTGADRDKIIGKYSV